MSKVKISAAVLLLCVSWLSACAEQTLPAPKPRPLQIGWSLYPGWYPLLIAEKMGYFEKYGADVQLNFYANYKDVTPPLASGYIDAGALVLGDALLDGLAKNVKIVLVTDRSVGADQFLAEPGIKSADDIRGKRIGAAAGAFGGLLTREMLAFYKLQPADAKLVEIPPEQIPGALSQYVEIGHTYEPYASEARAQGNNILFTTAQAPDLIARVVVFRREVLAERPQDAKNFIRAWFDAVAYWQANPEAGSRLIAEATGLDEKNIHFKGVEFLDREANLAAFQTGTDRSPLAAAVEADSKYLVNIGLVAKPIPPEDILDDSFLR